MIRMIGNHICKDCVSAMEVIQRERLPIEFHDMEKALDYVKEFLEIREGNPELYKEARENNQIGIPVFVLEDVYKRQGSSHGICPACESSL